MLSHKKCSASLSLKKFGWRLNSSLFGFVQVLFQRGQAVLASRVEEIIEKLQGIEIYGGGVTALFKHLENSTNDGLQHIDRISDQNGP